MALRFEALSLTDIHTTIAYNRRHSRELDPYTATRQDESKQARQQVEQHQGLQHIRERVSAIAKQG